MPAIAAALSSSVPPASVEAGAERLRQHEHVARPGAALAEHPVGVHDTLHGEPEDRLGVADRVPAGDRAAGLGDDRGGGVEDRGDRLAREVLGEGGDVDRQHDPPAHREHVAAGVGRGDRAEVGRVVDERREEVGGRHEGDVVADAVDGGVVERRQADEQRRVGRRREVGDEVRRAAPRPTWRRTRRTTSTRSAAGRRTDRGDRRDRSRQR